MERRGSAPEGRRGQAAEELPLAPSAGHGAPHGLTQFLAGGPLAALALGLVPFGAGGPLCGGAVTRLEAAQSEFLFQEAGLGLDADGVAVEVGAVAVLAGEGGEDVDVVIGVPDGDPAAARALVGVVDAGGGDHASGDVAPLRVREDPVGGAVAYGQVPHVRLGPLGIGEEGKGLVEELLELLVRGHGVAAGVGGGVVPGRHEVRVDVLFGLARPVQVGEQAYGALPALVDSRDHGLQRLSRSLSVAIWTRSVARRTAFSAASNCASDGWSPELTARASWLRLFPTWPRCRREAKISEISSRSPAIDPAADSGSRAAARAARARKAGRLVRAAAAASTSRCFSVSLRRTLHT